MTFLKKMRARKISAMSEAQRWFDELDAETQQETAIKYLRRLDSRSLKKLYEAIDLYRQADKILNQSVKDPEPQREEETIPPLEVASTDS